MYQTFGETAPSEELDVVDANAFLISSSTIPRVLPLPPVEWPDAIGFPFCRFTSDTEYQDQVGVQKVASPLLLQ